MTRRGDRRSLTRRALAILGTAASVIALSAIGVGPASATPTIGYGGSVPGWASHSSDGGRTASSATVEGEIYLKLPHPQAAQDFAIAVSTPGNAQYRHWLKPQQWINTFSPSPKNFNSVVKYLKGRGLTITGGPASRLYIVFRGTAGRVNAAFGTTLHDYRHADARLVAPSSPPVLPASVGAAVSAVSLDQSRTLTRPDSIRQDRDTSAHARAGAGAAPQQPAAAPLVNAPCSTYWGQNTATVPAAYNGQSRYPTAICGYLPSQLRSAYNLTSLARQGVNGGGQTVAIIDAYASPSIVGDTDRYSAQNGEPLLAKGQYSQIVPTRYYDQALCSQPSGWQSEQTLDVEAVHAIAPNASILYVGGFNCAGGLDVAMSAILDKGLATIVSNSYGDVGEDLPAAVIAGEQNLHLQAAGEGIGLYFSSGDNGDEVDNLGYAAPDFPASSPYVTSVGGTAIGIDRDGTPVMETGWGDTLDTIVQSGTGRLAYLAQLPGGLFGGGAGGGASSVNAQPDYQKGVVPASLSHGMRVSPDLAALADPYTGFEVGISPITDDITLATGAYLNDTFGGTSLAVPVTAAQMALAQQLTGQRIGFANPSLYGLAKTAPGTFRDVLPTSRLAVAYTGTHSGTSYLVTLNTDTSLVTAKGYDDVTGLGAMSFAVAQQTALGKH